MSSSDVTCLVRSELGEVAHRPERDVLEIAPDASRAGAALKRNGSFVLFTSMPGTSALK